MRHSRASTLLTVLGLAAITFVGSPAAADTTTTAHQAPPAFLFTGDRDHDGITSIYLRRTDGSLKRLTFAHASDAYPDWSPDGRKIVFARVVGVGMALFIMNADGSNVHRLTRPVAHPTVTITSDLSPAWSPDGRQIVFTSNRRGADVELWRVNPDGTHLTRLTFTPVGEQDPSWSPNGRIWFTAAGQIFSMRRDGTDRRQVTHTAEDEFYADVSPDGRRVVFSRTNAVGFSDIWTMRSDGSGARRLFTGPQFRDELDAQWTADGRRVFYVLAPDLSAAPGDAEVWRVNADGTNNRQISGDNAGEAQPIPYPVPRRR